MKTKYDWKAKVALMGVVASGVGSYGALHLENERFNEAIENSGIKTNQKMHRYMEIEDSLNNTYFSYLNDFELADMGDPRIKWLNERNSNLKKTKERLEEEKAQLASKGIDTLVNNYESFVNESRGWNIYATMFFVGLGGMGLFGALYGNYQSKKGKKNEK